MNSTFNTFVQRGRYQPNRYRVATYVKHRNGGAGQYKALSGFMTFGEARDLALDMRDATWAWLELQAVPSYIERFREERSSIEAETRQLAQTFCGLCGFWVNGQHQCPPPQGA